MKLNRLLLFLIFFKIYLMEKDYYQILGVPRNFDKATLKKQYRKLAKKYHPDNNSDKENYANKMFIAV